VPFINFYPGGIEVVIGIGIFALPTAILAADSSRSRTLKKLTKCPAGCPHCGMPLPHINSNEGKKHASDNKHPLPLNPRKKVDSFLFEIIPDRHEDQAEIEHDWKILGDSSHNCIKIF
jgi:hypothetical protein